MYQLQVPRYYVIPLQDLQSPVLVHGVICLMQVQEDLIEDILTHCFQALKYIGLTGDCTCPTVVPKYMQHIMELYGFTQ